MRTRPIAVLSALALSGLLLAGCTGDAEPDASPTDGADGTDICAQAAPSGDASDSVEVGGEPGESATATFDTPIEVTEAERTVAVEGDGAQLEEGDLVEYALTVFDATSGELLDSVGYGDGAILPVTLAAQTGPDQFFGCATVGSRIVMALPASGNNTAAVYVLDVLGTTPDAAWGEEQDAPEGFPAVELADNGAPTITIPDADAPTDVEIAVLKEGDGRVVGEGDGVLVQYTGVKWSDGTVFDSSWDRGAPATFSTTGVVAGFQQALEGQTVGSQVLVVIPPEFGYGAQDGHELQNETLVFVVDILASQSAA